MKWISVKERLPGTSSGFSEDVLVITEDGHINIAVYYEHNADDWHNAYCEQYTHWMPLPDPPQP